MTALRWFWGLPGDRQIVIGALVLANALVVVAMARIVVAGLV